MLLKAISALLVSREKGVSTMPHITEEAHARLSAGDSSHDQPPVVTQPTRIFFRLSDGSVVKLSDVSYVGPIVSNSFDVAQRMYSMIIGACSESVVWLSSDKDAKEHEQCHLSLLMALGVWDA